MQLRILEAESDANEDIKTDLTKKINYELRRNQTTVCKSYRISQNATNADSKFTVEDFKKLDFLALTQVLGLFMPIVQLATKQDSYLLGTEDANLVMGDDGESCQVSIDGGENKSFKDYYD